METQDYVMYLSSTPIHDSWISLIPPALIPIWNSYIGGVKLIQSIWDQLKEEINGFAFYLSGVTTTLYTLKFADLHLEYQYNEGMHQLLWYAVINYISNNTKNIPPSYAITEINYSSLPGDQVQVRISLENTASEPGSFTIDSPARIAFDFPDTKIKDLH